MKRAALLSMRAAVRRTGEILRLARAREALEIRRHLGWYGLLATAYTSVVLRASGNLKRLTTDDQWR